MAVWVQLLEGQGIHAHVIHVLHECIWNMPIVLLVLAAFNDTSSLGSPPHWVVYPSSSTLDDCLSFPCRE